MKVFMKTICISLVLLLSYANSAFAYDVIFNTKSLIYHTFTCEWARKCTRNCIKIDHTLAQRSGGVPCNACGGRERTSLHNNHGHATELCRLNHENFNDGENL